jgi:hypothetical protein
MIVDVMPGGHRRIDRVLDPGFVADIDRLDLAELRSRREQAEDEEADISYLRRLLQGRLDILRAELVRRSQSGDRDVASLLEGLPAILTDDEPVTAFGAVPRRLVPTRADQHRRRVEVLVSDETIASLPELDAADLAEIVERLGSEEATVSARRRAVQRVVDALRSELARRYRDGSAQVSELLE